MEGQCRRPIFARTIRFKAVNIIIYFPIKAQFSARHVT